MPDGTAESPAPAGIEWGVDWLLLPNGSGIHRTDLTPCSCGQNLLDYRPDPSGRAFAVGCPFCVKWRPGQDVAGTIDAATGRLAIRREPRERRA